MIHAATPLLSVIVPTYNRADVLAVTLDAFEHQTVPRDTFEIVVCDDGSTDHTPAVIERHRARSRRRLLALAQRNAGANRARNRAIDAASGGLLLVVNDDTVPTPGLVAAHLDAQARHADEKTAVLGRMTLAPGLPYSPFGALHHDASFTLIDGRADIDWRFFFTCNVSVNADFLRAAGGFDEALRWHEDIELGERLARRGMRLYYAPNALGHHHHVLREADYLAIADKEGAALAAWYKRRPDLLPVLREIGLHRALRHRLADLASPRWSLPLWTLAARGLLSANEAAALGLFRRLFQRRKRLAIAAALAGRP